MKDLWGEPIYSASEALARVPKRPGCYAIYVRDPALLPSPFAEVLTRRGTRLIYLGIATKSLWVRLCRQDLQHTQPSTFFRGIGAIWNYRPQQGSLIGKANQNNYRFSTSDTAKIVGRINTDLEVSWVEGTAALEDIEKKLIHDHRPLLNTKHNPDALVELAVLRAECRTIARDP
jgi:hypothetical protein